MNMPFDDINKIVGQLLKERRTALGYSQESLASKVDLSRASIANIERGEQSVNIEQLMKFSRELRVSPEQILPKLPNSDFAGLSNKTRSWVESILDETLEVS